MSLSPELRERLSSLVQSNQVFVFMKGTREAPQCGFSATVVQILDSIVPDYSTLDVLSDPEVRSGIKEFSEWPTIPQLYIDGEFAGGCDIVGEMYQSGELHQALGLPLPEAITPKITITDEAVQVLREAMQGREDQTLHLSIDAHFRNSLSLGPRQDGKVELEVNGITVVLDRDSGVRADGVTLHVEQTAQGPRLALENPNAPPSESRPETRG